MKSVAPDAFSQEQLERIWAADIEPWLEEHFYGQWEPVAQRFTWRSLLKTIPAPTPGEEPDGVARPRDVNQHAGGIFPKEQPSTEVQ